MKFALVRTLADLETPDEDQMKAGYLESALRRS